MATQGTELLERGGMFVFLDPLENQNNPHVGGNFLRPLLQYLPGDHLQPIK